MWLLIVVAFIVAALFAAALAVKSLIIICPPNQVAVVSGRTRALSDGRSVGYRVIKGGRTVRIPLMEKVDYMDLNTIPIEVSVTNAYSKGAIPLDVQGVANIKVASREGILENSVERFLGRSPDYIQQIAKENLEANLRGVLATLTPEEVNEDRLKFAQTLIDEADDDIKTLGLELDVLKIQNVTDQVGYLEAVGRRRTAGVLREARETEAGQAAEADEAEATGRQRAELARVQADLVIAEQENKLRVRQAELDAEAMASEKRADVASEQARVVAEQELEAERIVLQKRRLEADVIAPARAEQQAMELAARGRAASIVEDGNAKIAVFERMAEEFASAGPDARDIIILNMLPELVEQITDTVANIDIDKITVIDSGSSGNGSLGGLAGQMPAAVISLVEQIETATGVNILEVLVRDRSDGTDTTASPDPALPFPPQGLPTGNDVGVDANG
ncbi:MAG: SPFH domain-containing protein [Acidimicrobiia bacterium]|nr:SPFH domain-containing protein [Acidimicrobiia bacterium]